MDNPTTSFFEKENLLKKKMSFLSFFIYFICHLSKEHLTKKIMANGYA
jgi:hypothetical protein